MDLPARRVLDRVPDRVDVLGNGSRQRGDHRPLNLGGDATAGLEVAGAADGEAGLDDVDAETGELMGDLDLLVHVERETRCLLSVAQGGVEDVDAIVRRRRLRD